jgi:molybdopterin-guanine dinucleotide biosynthesis protein A
VIGAVLAGGRGERLGGSKALAELGGRPLVEHAIAALRAVTDEVVVVAKPGTALPPVDVPVWHDDEAGFHPRHGIVTALRRAGGAPVLVLAVDLPRADVRSLADARGTAVARDEDGRLQPLCARYAPEALATLEAAPPDEPLTRTVERLDPAIVDAPAGTLLNVNTPQDLADADRRS